jgi:hypothetical protein
MRMTRQGNLGPVLAIAGAAIALTAVAAGFVLVGGPSDARNRRLDERTERALQDVIKAVQCAYNVTGVAAPTLAEAKLTPGTYKNSTYHLCRDAMFQPGLDAIEDRDAVNPGDVSYAAIGPSQIELCAVFRAAAEANEAKCLFDIDDAFGALWAAREPGLQCFEFDLVQRDYEAGHSSACAYGVFGY